MDGLEAESHIEAESETNERWTNVLYALVFSWDSIIKNMEYLMIIFRKSLSTQVFYCEPTGGTLLFILDKLHNLKMMISFKLFTSSQDSDNKVSATCYIHAPIKRIKM